MTKLITIPKFAAATGLPYRLCLHLIGTGQIPSVAVGRRRRIDVRWVKQWLATGGYRSSRAQFSRVPREVAGDRRLNPRDVRVYAALAPFCWQGATAQVGKRLLAKLACCAERLVIASLKKLEATGHIKKQPVRRGKRGRYVLLSPIFGQKQRADIEEIVQGPRSQYLATVRKDQGKAWNSRSAPLKSSPRAKERNWATVSFERH